mmetsp:Transcript_80425/g.239615  ORF Transcript_80425/g.239615 Transcript_80425/m.239615 type:complete len:282 (-) Transcript_80425:1023-1868(-)
MQPAPALVDGGARARGAHQHHAQVDLPRIGVRIHPGLAVVDLGATRCGGVADEDRERGAELRQRPNARSNVEVRGVAVRVGLDVESLVGTAYEVAVPRRDLVHHGAEGVVGEVLADLPVAVQAARQQQARRVECARGDHQQAVGCNAQNLGAAVGAPSAEARGLASAVVDDLQDLRAQPHLKVRPLQRPRQHDRGRGLTEAVLRRNVRDRHRMGLLLDARRRGEAMRGHRVMDEGRPRLVEVVPSVHTRGCRDGVHGLRGLVVRREVWVAPAQGPALEVLL